MADLRGFEMSAGGAAAVSALPRFDPLAPRPQDRAFKHVLLISLLLHLILLWAFWDQIIGLVVEDEDEVMVKMLEDEPEPPKPKLLQQRMLDTDVLKQKEIMEQEIEVVRPEMLLNRQKVEVNPLQNIDAPRLVERREIVTDRVNVFAEKPKRVQLPNVRVAKVAPKKVYTAKANTGPRKVQAAGPRIQAEDVRVNAPNLAEGVISDTAVRGAAEGEKIRDIESGAGSSMLTGRGESGSLVGSVKDCNKDPVCLAYLKMIRDRVYARWTIPPDTEIGRVVLDFRIDRGGAAHDIILKSSDDPILGKTCEAAFRHASPFPPPPQEIRYLVNKGIKASFSYGN